MMNKKLIEFITWLRWAKLLKRSYTDAQLEKFLEDYEEYYQSSASEEIDDESDDTQ